jgi:hypothetical protein
MGIVTNRQLFDRGPTCRGLAVDRDGVALGPILALVWREDGGYAATSVADMGLLLREVFRCDVDPAPVALMLQKIAEALDDGNLIHAQMLGLQTPFATLDFGRLDNWKSRAARLVKYNADQPRVPAGSGRASGEWTSGSLLVPTDAAGPATPGTDPTETPRPAFLKEPPVTPVIPVTPEPPGSGLTRNFWSLLEQTPWPMVRKLLGALDLLIPSGPINQDISEPVAGRPDLRLNTTDEGQVSLDRINADGSHTRLIDFQRHSGPLLTDSTGKVYGAWINGRIVLNPDALPPVAGGTSPAPQGAPAPAPPQPGLGDFGNSREPPPTNNDDKPKLCPDPGPDVPHGAKERGWAYQEQITGLPRGVAVTLNGVTFDGCRESDGTMLEAKGPGYESGLDKDGNWQPWYDGKDELINQAIKQSKAAGSRQVEWHAATPVIKKALTALIDHLKITNIHVIYTPAI